LPLYPPFLHFCILEMSVIILLMIFSILVAGIFLAAYLWSASTGQFEDPEAHAFRILHDGSKHTIKPQNKK
jgi:cbb3-type cytochrome oxidase maturation protein